MTLKPVLALAIAAALAAPVAAQQAPRTPDIKESAPAGGGASAGGFRAMDSNNDGYISRHEARDAAWSNRFSELDKDNDGRLSQSEFDALGADAAGAAGATVDKDARSPSTTGSQKQ